MKKLLLKTWLLLTCLLLGVGSAWADSYTITFKTGSNDGTSVSTSTKCSDLVTAGSDYLSGNLATATNVYNAGGSGLKLGTSSNSGTLKMNLSETGKVSAISVIVRAKQYNSSKATKLALNGKTAQNLSADFADYTFTLNSDITYLELVSSKGTSGGAYCWIESITVNYGTSGDNPAPTTYTVTVANDIENGTVTASTTSAAEGATVTLTATPDDGYEFGSWNVTDASSNSITVTDNKFNMPAADVNVSATFTAKLARPENEIFYESFNTNDGTGGNDDQWSGSIASNNIKQDNEGWTYEKGSGAYLCAKFGTGSALGSATTPALGQACNATLTFKAAAWNGNSESTTLKLSVIGGGSISPATVTMTKGAWNSFEVTLTNLTTASKIKFEGNAASNSRFFLDEVSIVKTGDATPEEKTLSSIEVKTAPTKVTYTEGDMFEPAGLVITASYSDATNEDVAYADHTSDFTFDPSLTTSLATTNTSVTITYGGKTTTQAILVNAAEPNPEEGDGKTYNFSSFTQANDVTLEADNFTITLHKNNGSTAPTWNGSSNEARVYANGSVDVTSTKTISKIVYNYTINANSKGVSPTVDAVAGETNAGTWDADTKKWTGTDTKVTLSTSGSAGNLGFKSITVYFEEETTPEPESTTGTLNFVAKNADGYWATFSSTESVIFDANDVLVYTVAVDDGSLVMIDAENSSLSCVTDKTKDDGWVAGYYVQAGAGVLINSIEENVNYYYIDTDPYTANVLNSIENNPEYNMLRPSYEKMTGNYMFYKLAYGDWDKKTGLGFYWGAENGGAFETWDGGAYLAVPASMAARSGFSFADDTEALDAIEINTAATTIYTLNGFKVSEMDKGLYIKDGKKVMVK